MKDPGTSWLFERLHFVVVSHVALIIGSLSYRVLLLFPDNTLSLFEMQSRCWGRMRPCYSCQLWGRPVEVVGDVCPGMADVSSFTCTHLLNRKFIDYLDQQSCFDLDSLGSDAGLPPPSLVNPLCSSFLTYQMRIRIALTLFFFSFWNWVSPCSLG